MYKIYVNCTCTKSLDFISLPYPSLIHLPLLHTHTTSLYFLSLSLSLSHSLSLALSLALSLSFSHAVLCTLTVSQCPPCQ